MNATVAPVTANPRSRRAKAMIVIAVVFGIGTAVGLARTGDPLWFAELTRAILWFLIVLVYTVIAVIADIAWWWAQALPFDLGCSPIRVCDPL